MGLNKIFSSFLSISSDDHESPDDLLSFGQVWTCLTVQNSFKFFNLSQFTESLLKLITSEIHESNVPLDFACPYVFHSVRILVYIESFTEVNQSLGNLASLFLPSAQLGGNPC